MNEVLLEFHVIDDMVRVAAIDGETGTEAVLVGPLSAGREMLGRAATRKLKYVLSRRTEKRADRASRPGYWA
jgi:hypothetical protein